MGGRRQATGPGPVLDPQNVLWHFGALAGTAACVTLDAEVPESARGLWVLLVSLAFLAAYAAAAYVLRRAGRLVPAGVLAATALTFVPIAGVAFERLVGIVGPDGNAVATFTESYGSSVSYGVAGPSFHGSTFALALLTVIVGVAVYRLVRYAFVFAWVATAALIATQILVPAIASHPGADGRFDAALAAGLLFVVLGLYLDRLGRRREAFW